jgi:hypothetical protein
VCRKEARRGPLHQSLKSPRRSCMRSLPSSAEDRIWRLKSDLVLTVHLKRGASWEAINEIRIRRGIEAPAQIPPPITPGAYYAPPGFPEEVAPEEAGYKEWQVALESWTGELLTLYRFVPENCRETVGSDFLNWIKFLSALVIFDPPVPGLREFRDALDEARMIPRLMPAPNEPEYQGVGLPLRWVRGEEDTPGWVIDVRPEHTDDDILHAARVIRGTFSEHPKPGARRATSCYTLSVPFYTAAPTGPTSV